MAGMGRTYTVVIANVNSPAAQFDMFEVVPAAAKPVQVNRLIIGQITEPTTEEEMLMITFVVGHTTSGSGGSTPTPGRQNRQDAAAGFTVETMNTTIASGGTTETIGAFAFNTRGGLDLAFAPEEAPQIINGERLVIRCSAPADAIGIVATLFVEEIG